VVQFLGLEPGRPVALDAVGTLMVPAEPVAETYCRYAARWGLAMSTEEVESRFRRLYAEIWGPAAQVATSHAMERDRWHQLIARLFCEAPQKVDRLFETLWDHYADGAAWGLAPGVAPLMRVLRRRGIIWGIASNFDRRLHGVVKTFPELSNARTVMTSADIGYSKPATQFFNAVSVRLEHAEPLMLGDSFEHDVAGALRSGWQAAWITTSVTEPDWGDLDRSRLVFRGSLLDFARYLELGPQCRESAKGMKS
jgi:REG-2-like HAD superfamily hydrolase